MAAHDFTVAPFIPPYSLGVDFDDPQPVATMAEAVARASSALQAGKADTVTCIMDATGRVWAMKRLANGDIVEVPF